jgi:hypothetical protein
MELWNKTHTHWFAIELLFLWLKYIVTNYFLGNEREDCVEVMNSYMLECHQFNVMIYIVEIWVWYLCVMAVLDGLMSDWVHPIDTDVLGLLTYSHHGQLCTIYIYYCYYLKLSYTVIDSHTQMLFIYFILLFGKKEGSTCVVLDGGASKKN